MANSDYKIGVVGVGRMGANIARHLNDEGFDVTVVYDVASERAQELATELDATCSRRTDEGHSTCRLHHYSSYRRRGDADNFLGRCGG